MFTHGFTLGLSLIGTIGPQNAFVLQQGRYKKNAIFAGMCMSLCDAALISISVFGTAQSLDSAVIKVLSMGGLVFLLYYACAAFRVSANSVKLDKPHLVETQKINIFLKALAFSCLNPYAFIDIFVIIGTTSCQYKPPVTFALGCIIASFLWFFALSILAICASEYLQKPSVWRYVNSVVGLMCLYSAYLVATNLITIW